LVSPAAAALIAVVGLTPRSVLSAQDSQFADATTDAASAGTSLGFPLRSHVPVVSTAAGSTMLLPEGPMASRGSNVAKGALIGGGVGLVVGITAAVAYKNQECEPALEDCGELDLYAPAIAAGFTVLGVAIGTLVGLATPAGDSDGAAGIEPGAMTLAVIPSGQTIAVGLGLRF
jgi:hypothetical protein